jgi:hydrogenase nickel incorporation protein HypA/HybF
MHELSVTDSLLKLAIQHATAAKAARVTELHLVVGQLSSIVDDSVQFYWDMISQGTICEGARLNFRRVAATMSCLDCNTIYTLNGELSACPQCQSERVTIKSGEEFYLDSIEVETVPDLAKASA